jgi:aromatic-L-amino-acid decarboxylase
MRTLLSKTSGYAADFLDGLATGPVEATANVETLRSRLSFELPDQGIAPDQVIADLVAATDGGHLRSAGGRFFAWVIGGALPSALAADWLTSTWDNNAALYACGPASSVVEEVAGAWIKDLLRLPAEASFAFTTGCQMAHFTCLAAARNALLRNQNWDVEKLGLTTAPSIRILATEQRHGSLERAARHLGLGTAAITPLQTDAQGRVQPDALAEALRRDPNTATIVHLDAADLNVGAVDPFARLIPLARSAGCWVHIDGAFGLWARVSDTHRDKLAGVELADSWSTDAHKWLNTPKDIGIAIVRDADAHRRSMSISASYLSSSGDTRDQIDWTPEWTRRARGFPVYAALRELGRHGLAELVDRCCEFALQLTSSIGSLHGVELVACPTLNQGLVRFLSPNPEAGDAEHDQWTDAVIAAINREGTAFFSGTTWRGRRAMRISVVNWRTSAGDIEATVQAVSRVLSDLLAQF